MKKFILLLILAIGFSVAQTYSQVIILPAEKFGWTYTGISTDTVGATGTTFVKEIRLNKRDAVFYNAKVKVSDVLADAGCTVALQGKVFDTDAYSTITTYEWKGAGTDTTLVYTGNTNKIFYRYLKILVTGTATKAKVNYIYLTLKK